MDLECKIVNKLGVQTGRSARGEWSKQEFIVEYQDGNYPAQVCMNVWGQDKVNDLAAYNVGDRIKVSFNLSSREFNGRWYTDVRAWRIERADASAPAAAPAAAPRAAAAPAAPAPVAPAPTAEDVAVDIEVDDLPF